MMCRIALLVLLVGLCGALSPRGKLEFKCVDDADDLGVISYNLKNFGIGDVATCTKIDGGSRCFKDIEQDVSDLKEQMKSFQLQLTAMQNSLSFKKAAKSEI
jgi:hypothetical protein